MKKKISKYLTNLLSPLFLNDIIIVNNKKASHTIDPYNMISTQRSHFQEQFVYLIFNNKAPKNVNNVNINYIASGDLIFDLY